MTLLGTGIIGMDCEIDTGRDDAYSVGAKNVMVRTKV